MSKHNRERRELRAMSVGELGRLRSAMPQRRTELPPDLEEQAKRIWAIIGEVCPNRTYEVLEHDFTFDHNPDKELDEVEKIALAYQDWCKAFPFAAKDAKKDALASGYMLSLCAEGPLPLPEMAHYYEARGGVGKPLELHSKGGEQMKAITSEGAKVYTHGPPDLTDTSQEAWQYALDNPDKLGNAPEITDEVIKACKAVSA